MVLPHAAIPACTFRCSSSGIYYVYLLPAILKQRNKGEIEMALGFIRNMVDDFWDLATSPDGRGTPPPPRSYNRVRPARVQNVRAQIISQTPSTWTPPPPPPPQHNTWTSPPPPSPPPPQQPDVNQILRNLRKQRKILEAALNKQTNKTAPQQHYEPPPQQWTTLTQYLPILQNRHQQRPLRLLHGTSREAATDIYYNRRVLPGEKNYFWLTPEFMIAKGHAKRKGWAGGLIVEFYIDTCYRLGQSKPHWVIPIPNPQPQTYYHFPEAVPTSLQKQDGTKIA